MEYRDIYHAVVCILSATENVTGKILTKSLNPEKVKILIKIDCEPWERIKFKGCRCYSIKGYRLDNNTYPVLCHGYFKHKTALVSNSIDVVASIALDLR